MVVLADLQPDLQLPMVPLVLVVAGRSVRTPRKSPRAVEASELDAKLGASSDRNSGDDRSDNNPLCVDGIARLYVWS
jgi:hypothetical protein